MISKLLSHKNKIFVLFLIFFSVIINQYYGSRGVFPLDSFHFFDAGYRVLEGDIPFMDYWLVKGPLLDYMQAVLFYIFGVNWQTYLLHASIINASMAVATFFVLKNFNLNTFYCFFYAFLFSILAYPSSGTPFIDHHSAFFSLLGIYSFLLAIKNQKKVYWLLIPLFLILAFFSKQVPAAYIILSIGFILLIYSSVNKKLDYIKYTFISSSFFIILVLIFGKYQGIIFNSFLDQYIFYPQTIGADRFKNISLTFNNLIGNFKFIWIVAIPLFYENFRKILFNKNYLKDSNFYIFLTLFFLIISLILHQLLTKNQIFIFFLIPILTAFSHLALNNSKLKFKKIISVIIILICLFATFKYHLRFNENRKFHELVNVNFDLAIDATKIHYKLSGLNWITPQFKDNPKQEINIINQIQSYLKNDPRNKMVITNYPFFSVILNQNLLAPSRVYTGDGTTHPIKGNKYTSNYKELMDHLISKNNISVIYMIDNDKENLNFHYIESYRHCFKEVLLFEQLVSYELKDCI